MQYYALLLKPYQVVRSAIDSGGGGAGTNPVYLWKVYLPYAPPLDPIPLAAIHRSKYKQENSIPNPSK